MKGVLGGVLLVAALGGTAAAGSYRWPTTFGIVVTAGYDNNNGTGAPLDWQCGGNSYSNHRGTDIGTPRFTDVYAGAGGWVKASADGFGDGGLGSTDGGGFGNHIAIYHGAGDETIYGHLTAGTGLPANGATVACSEHIGQSGTSGNSSGPHLHFETRVGVDEAGSYYSGSADDPYMGPCSGPLSYWTNQNGGAPTTDCFAPVPPDMCGGLTAECQGNVLRVCDAGTIVDHDCTGDGLACGTDGAGAPACVAPPGADADGDGTPAGADCDDADPAVHPGATESCDGVDSDCSGTTDDDLVRSCCGTGMQNCAGADWGACDVVCADPDQSNDVAGGCAVGHGGGRGAPGTSCTLLLLLGLATVRRVSRASRRSASRPAR